MTVRRITKEDLMSRLDEPQSIIIDLRSNWAGSALKIRRAKRENPAVIWSWVNNYPKSTELTLYCSSPGEKDSLRVAETLTAAGFESIGVLSGGWRYGKPPGFLRKNGYPIHCPRVSCPMSANPDPNMDAMH